MKIILGVRKLLGSTFRIGVVWLMAGALFLAWVMWQDLFHLEYPFGYYYFFAGPSLTHISHINPSGRAVISNITT